MNMENNTLKRPGVAERPSVKKHLAWALVWFGALLAVRMAVVPLAGMLGLDESNQYLLVKPVAYATDGALLAVGFLLFVRFVFSNTLGRDLGTRFNDAWGALDDPFKILMVYVAFGAPIFIALAMLLGMN